MNDLVERYCRRREKERETAREAIAIWRELPPEMRAMVENALRRTALGAESYRASFARFPEEEQKARAFETVNISARSAICALRALAPE
jgi:hypothetical protein